MTKVNSKGVPRNAVIAMAICAMLITLPALKGNAAGDPFPFAFFAVVSITVIGLYIAFAIPIYLRWRAGDSFIPGPWTNGRKYKWMNPFAVLWTALITVIFCLPFTPGGGAVQRRTSPGRPSTTRRSWSGCSSSGPGIAWAVSAKNWFTGQESDLDKLDEELADEFAVAARTPRARSLLLA